MKQFYIPILFALLISVVNSSRVHADIFYPDSIQYIPGAEEQAIIDLCESKNWFEKWWCDCCSGEHIEDLKKRKQQAIAEWEEKEKKSKEERRKIDKAFEQVRRSQASDPLQKILIFDENIEERLEVLEQKVRELESR